MITYLSALVSLLWTGEQEGRRALARPDGNHVAQRPVHETPINGSHCYFFFASE
jgi:hypothetical protein